MTGYGVLKERGGPRGRGIPKTAWGSYGSLAEDWGVYLRLEGGYDLGN